MSAATPPAISTSGSNVADACGKVDPGVSVRGANRVLGRPAFRWKLVSMDGAQAVASCGLPIPIEGAFNHSARQDALIVIAAFDVTSYVTPRILAALRAGAKRSAIVGGIEPGSWLLGFAGLLAGRRATTHWEDFEDFAALSPCRCAPRPLGRR